MELFLSVCSLFHDTICNGTGRGYSVDIPTGYGLDGPVSNAGED